MRVKYIETPMAIIRTLSNAEKEHHILRHSHATNLRPPAESFTSYTHLGTVVLTGPTRYGSKLNRVENFGLNGSITPQDLQKIENSPGFSRNCHAFYVSEHAHLPAFSTLETAGYASTGSISVLYAQLDTLEIPPHEDQDFTISQTNDTEVFVKASFEGFREGGRSPDLLDLLSRSAAARADTKLFIAECGDEIAASAAMAILQVDNMKLAMLYIDSSISRLRGRGLHLALIRARLQVAIEEGCNIAMASARSRSTSAANLLKGGLRHGYESVIYSYKAS
jgi:hypothetical protein